MDIRRVVTGVTEDGRARFVSDEPVKARVAAMLPGLQMFYLWGADEKQSVPTDGKEPSWGNHFPTPDGFRATVCVLPPASLAGHEGPLTDEEVAEAEASFPGLLETFDPDDPGAHTSNTVDIAFVMSGLVDLELDDGEVRHLASGDLAIQNGTRHKWTNTGDTEATLVFILVGADARN